MVSCLFRVRGVTNGTNVSSTAASALCALYSNIWSGTVQYIKIPIGMTLKIHQVSISGTEETLFSINYEETAANTYAGSWVAYDDIYLGSAGHLDVMAGNRPWTFYGTNGTSGIGISWSGQSTATVVQFHMTCELTDEPPRR